MLITGDLHFHHSLIMDAFSMKRKTERARFLLFLVGEVFDERLMKNYPTGCQSLTSAYHQIISYQASSIPTEQQYTSSAGRTMHTAEQCTTDLMLAQARVFPTGRKYRSLLGDFSSRIVATMLKIPNRPRVLHPSGHPAKTVGKSRAQTGTRDKRNRMSNE